MFNHSQVKSSVTQVIKQAAGTGDYDLNAGPEPFGLGLLADPTVYGEAS